MSGSKVSAKRIYNARQDSSQSSPTLLPQVIATGLENNGQSNNPDNILEVPSLTSTNNFINFCADFLPLTNGQPFQQSSCNPAPMGHIPSAKNIPSTRFKEPQNGDVFLESSEIHVTLSTNNLATGNAVNSELNYLAAPQQLNSNGLVLGHYYIVVDALESFGQASPTDPTKPAFFIELGTPTQTLSTIITLPVGFYRMSAIVHSANHQPVVVPIEQHGSLNDVVYFIVQPNPQSKRSILGSTQQNRDRYFTSREKSKRNSFFSRQGRTRRQDPSTSLMLDPSVIASEFSQDGTSGASGQFTPSLTSTNNFINYCATLTGVPLTNGTAPLAGPESCNAVPIGILPSSQNMPSVKFTSPAFNDTLKQNTPFLVSLNVTNFVSGKSTNSEVNFLSAPQQLVQAGRIIGHTGVVIEEYSTDGTITNPRLFSYAATIDASGSSSSGIFSVNVSGGLPVGFYRLSSILSTANHQPVVMSYNDHGALDDAIFFSVTENGGGPPPLPTLSTISAPITPRSTAATGSSTAPPDTTSAATQSDNPRKTQSTAGPIAGATIGVALILGIALVAFFLWKKRKAKKERNEFSVGDSQIDNQIGLTPFQVWYGSSLNSNPTMLYSPPSDPKGISAPSPEQGSLHVNLLGSTSNLISSSNSNTGKSTRRSTNRSEHEATTSRSQNRISSASLAPSYHTTVS